MTGGIGDSSRGGPDPTARHRLRIRTVAVSFGAAVSSAHQDSQTSAAERDAQIEVWRAWCLDTLEGYRPEMVKADGLGTDPQRRPLVSDLDDAVESVRRA